MNFLATVAFFSVFSSNTLQALSKEIRILQISKSAAICHQRLGELEDALKTYTEVSYTFCESHRYINEFDGIIAIPEDYKIHQKRWYSNDLWQAYPTQEICEQNLDHEIDLFKTATGLTEILMGYCYKASSLNTLTWSINIIANGESEAYHFLTQLGFGGRVNADLAELQSKIADAFTARGIKLTSIHPGREMIGQVIIAGYYKEGMKMYINTNAVGDIETLERCTNEAQKWEKAFEDRKAIAVYCVTKHNSNYELQILSLDENAMDSREFRKAFTGGMYASRAECEANLISTRGFAQMCGRDVFSRQWGAYYFFDR
jgi:hypothetical protein